MPILIAMVAAPDPLPPSAVAVATTIVEVPNPKDSELAETPPLDRLSSPDKLLVFFDSSEDFSPLKTLRNIFTLFETFSEPSKRRQL